ncbi:MAG: 2-phospho-L-lactate guanylyltransferase [Pseudomonadota bacterium]
MENFWTIVPVKDTRYSKQRTSARLDAERRQGLALTMLEDVLQALAPTQDLSRLVLVTVDPTAIELAGKYGATTVDDGAHDGHTGAVTAAARALEARGASGYLTVPGDIPLISTQEVQRLLETHFASPRPAFTIAPSHDEMGSNAIACSPASAVPLRFGDDSYFPHLAAARAHGIEPTIVRCPGIAQDIDSPEDIDRVMTLPEIEKTRTYRYLMESASHAGADAAG